MKNFHQFSFKSKNNKKLNVKYKFSNWTFPLVFFPLQIRMIDKNDKRCAIINWIERDCHQIGDIFWEEYEYDDNNGEWNI